MSKDDFGWRPFLAALLKLQVAASTKLSNVVIDVLIVVIDPENMGIDTKSMPICVSEADILTKIILILTIFAIFGGHFEIHSDCLNLITQCYYWWSYHVHWPRKHGYRHQNYASMSLTDLDIDKRKFGWRPFFKMRQSHFRSFYFFWSQIIFLYLHCTGYISTKIWHFVHNERNICHVAVFIFKNLRVPVQLSTNKDN